MKRGTKRALFRCSLVSLALSLGSLTALAQTPSNARQPSALPPHGLVGGEPTMSGATSDTVITAHAKAALLGADNIDSSNVHVSTTNGVVTLTGTVADEAQKDRAERVVHGLDGVVSVTNSLDVAKAPH